MTQDEANQLYNAYKQVVEQQKKEEIELAKAQCNLRQEQYREQIKGEKELSNQAELAQRIQDAESYRDNKIQQIEEDAKSRIAAAEERLKENVEQSKQETSKEEQEKADNLLKENLQKDLESKQRELDKQQQELERQRELEQQKRLEEQNRER